jgi:hypothetical protein
MGGTTRKYAAIEGDGATKRTNFSAIGRWSKIEDGFNLLVPRLRTRWSKPKTNEVSFLYGPSHLRGLTSEAIGLKAVQSAINKGEMLFPRIASDLNVNVECHTVIVDKVMKALVQRSFSPVWGLTNF